MNKQLKSKIQWIDEKLDALMDQELPHPESIDFLVVERDKATAEILKEEFSRIDWEAK